MCCVCPKADQADKCAAQGIDAHLPHLCGRVTTGACHACANRPEAVSRVIAKKGLSDGSSCPMAESDVAGAHGDATEDAPSYPSIPGGTRPLPAAGAPTPVPKLVSTRCP